MYTMHLYILVYTHVHVYLYYQCIFMHTMYTWVYSCMLVYTPVYLCILCILCLLMYTHVNSCTLCILVYTPVKLCIRLMHTPFILVYNHVMTVYTRTHAGDDASHITVACAVCRQRTKHFSHKNISVQVRKSAVRRIH